MRFPPTRQMTVVAFALCCMWAGFGASEFVSLLQAAPEKVVAMQFDARDLSGLWVRTGGGGGIGPSANIPPLTPEGRAKMTGRVGTGDVPLPVYSNDPKFRCNPSGFPRILYSGTYPFEFAPLEGRILQLFQWERVLREIWMDGRDLPSGENLNNLGPAWYGHSVAVWEGDALVVNTVGLDDRAWLDGTGHPVSLMTRIEERWARTGADTLEVQLTLHDQSLYTAPWVGDTKTFTRMAPEEVTFFGWSGLFSGVWESICAPMNEVDDHNSRFLLPGSLGVDP